MNTSKASLSDLLALLIMLLISLAPYYSEFAVNNSYGIKAYNDTVYSYSKFALHMPSGCLSQIESCRAAAANGDFNYSTPISSESAPSVFSICSEAQSMCRDNVEGVYYS